ncbi:MAG: hypothetical protein MJ005_03450 [Methanocorpusculum sp.]|nr:hypothetical protein [Methanocorpusculum sp.]
MQKYIFNQKKLKTEIEKYVSENISQLSKQHENYLKWKEEYVTSGQILTLKETSHDAIFLESIFGDVLGYTLGGSKPTLKIKDKSATDSTVPDGKIGYYDGDEFVVAAVIELKDAGISLDEHQKREKNYTPVEQAFAYAPKQGGKCKWVIVSNFVEFRLYWSADAGKYEQFCLDTLNEDEFYRFCYLLSFTNLVKPNGKTSLIEKLYLSANTEEEKISKEFYTKYSALRKDLFSSLKKGNPNIDELVLFEKANKILDRFIFICFCEDKKLLPEDTISGIVNRSQQSFRGGVAWEEFKELCKSINDGNPRMNINRYNGGLFKDDNVLDSLVVTDEIMKQFSAISSGYDFDSDLNVNILGHIFEQSISDIELIKEKIWSVRTEERTDTKKGARKKDGIFYTPNSVTRYIVEQTVGRWCAEARDKIKRDLIGEDGFSISIPVSPKSKKSQNCSYR